MSKKIVGNWKRVGYLFLAFLVGAAFGYFSLPAKVVTKVEVKVVEKVVSDTTTKKDSDKHVVITEVTNKDGTKTKRTEIVDKSKIDTRAEVRSSTETESKSEKTVEYNKNSWFLRGMAGVTLGGGDTLRYGVGVDKRFLGPIYLGAYGFTDKSVGLSVGLSF